MNKTKHLLAMTAVSLMVPVSAGALDLNIGTGGGSGASVGVSVGGSSGGVSAGASGGGSSVSASLGGSAGGADTNTNISIGLPGTGGEGPGGLPGTTQFSAQIDNADPGALPVAPPALAAQYVGHWLISSNRVVLGQIREVRNGSEGMLVLNVEPVESLAIAPDRVWVAISPRPVRGGMVSLRMRSETFIGLFEKA